jgi:hypothetical protein
MMDSNSTIELLMRLLPLLIPILLIQLALMIYCLLDLARRETTKGPKWVWLLLIVLGQLWGPIVYLILGRQE